MFQAIEVDFTALDDVRRQHREAFRKQQGFSLTYLPFIARATCLAIEAFPLIKARFTDNALFVARELHLGIAVDLAHNGLVVPVVARPAATVILNKNKCPLNGSCPK